jgi:iron complex outermembrane receptor protein
MTSDTFELNATYEGEGFSIEAVAGNTKAEGGTQMSANFGYGWWGDKFGDVKWNGSVDATGKQIKVNGPDMSFGVDDLDTTIGTSQWTGVQGPNSDEEDYYQVDVDFDLDLGVINKFETGVRYTEHTFEKSEYKAVYGDGLNSFDSAGLFSGSMEVGTEGWKVPKGKVSAMISATESLVDQFVYNRGAYGQIEEENLSLYGMFSFEGEGFRGNFGLRYIETEVASSAHTIDNSPADALSVNEGWSTDLTSVKETYSDVLPSANIAFDLTDDIILRASAGQAMTRPNYDQLFLSSVSGYPDDRQGNEQIIYGDPGLLPMKSSQADLGVEYYYGEGNMVSATYFIKDVSNFVVGTAPQTGQSIGVPNTDLDDNADSWITSGFENVGGGEIEGIEFQINHGWDNGFGVNANYTYTDANAPSSVYTDEVGMFTESSEHSANLVGYWENDTFSARAAYNWRSEYMVREFSKYYGNRMHDDFGTLDMSFGWNATDNVKVSLEIVNLLEEDDVQYGVAKAGNTDVKPALQDGYPTWSFEGEATYKLGVSFNF